MAEMAALGRPPSSSGKLAIGLVGLRQVFASERPCLQRAACERVKMQSSLAIGRPRGIIQRGHGARTPNLFHRVAFGESVARSLAPPRACDPGRLHLARRIIDLAFGWSPYRGPSVRSWRLARLFFSTGMVRYRPVDIRRRRAFMISPHYSVDRSSIAVQIHGQTAR